MCHVLQLNERQGGSGPPPTPKSNSSVLSTSTCICQVFAFRENMFLKKTRMFIILSEIEIILNPDSYIYIYLIGLIPNNDKFQKQYIHSQQ